MVASAASAVLPPVSAGVYRDDARMVDARICAVSGAAGFVSDCCFANHCRNIPIALIDAERGF